MSTIHDTRVIPPGIVKAMSLIMQSPLLFIHSYHAQSPFLAPQSFLFHSMHFSHCPFILFLAFLSTSHSLHQILPFSSPTNPLFSQCVQTISTLLCSTSQLKITHDTDIINYLCWEWSWESVGQWLTIWLQFSFKTFQESLLGKLYCTLDAGTKPMTTCMKKNLLPIKIQVF